MLLLNGVQVPVTIFPDKTSQVWKLPEGAIWPSGNRVEWRFEHEGEFMHLAQLIMLIPRDSELYIPYLPYARQDKAVGNDTTFALDPFIALLNFLAFRRVCLYDPHNHEAVKRINGVELIDPYCEISAARRAVGATFVCFPDAGAKARYPYFSEGLTICAKKTRDPLTGEITGMGFEEILPWAGRPVLIVDDICDGGRTFIELAHLFKDFHRDEQPSEIHLYVSHGIFSKGTKVLRDAGIQRIFTKDGEVI